MSRVLDTGTAIGGHVVLWADDEISLDFERPDRAGASRLTHAHGLFALDCVAMFPNSQDRNFSPWGSTPMTPCLISSDAELTFLQIFPGHLANT
jgi:hypothetical protein